MIKRANILSFVASLALVGTAMPGVAQDTATQTDETATTETAVLPPSEGQGPATEEVVQAVHGDWQIRCREGEANCFMYQLAVDARGIELAEMTVVALKDDPKVAAGFTIVTPLRSLLTEGVAVQIDNGRPQRYRYLWCTEAGCFVRFGVEETQLAEFKRGNKARLTVIAFDRPDAPFVLDLSLKGFTAAHADLVSRD